MRAPRLAVAAAGLMLLAALVQGALAVNGGSNCAYYDYRQVNQILREKGITDPKAIQARIDSTLSVNGWLCATCNTRRMQMKNFGEVDPNRGECWCKQGYGYYELKNKQGQVRGRWFGCNKCRPAGTTTNATSGPYDTVKRSWSKTVCA